MTLGTPGTTERPATDTADPAPTGPRAAVPTAAPPVAAPTPLDSGVTRRAFLRVGALGVAAAGLYGGRSLLVPSLAERGLLSPDGVFGAASQAWADSIYTEVFPTSPLVLSPFTERIDNPRALGPSRLTPPPSKKVQTSLHDPNDPPNVFQQHQIWVDEVPPELGGPLPFPITYDVHVQVAAHSFTSSQVMPIDANGRPTASFDASGRRLPPGARALPPSTVYAFNGAFPGPRINAEYGKPVVVRLTNYLADAQGLPRQDFGTPDLTFLIHLHNGHTAPESDGNPHFFEAKYGLSGIHGYRPSPTGSGPGDWVDNLYLNWPAGGDDREKQSFFWFHDHRMDHTGANVYKGMVGLYPIYDPELDPGDESKGLHLPGVRTDHPDGSFDVDYDIPLALFDVRLDDGVTVHHDIHDGEFQEAFGIPGNRTHPEWWGRAFYKHFPNHGFVGDVFTVNGKAYPYMDVKRRKYRLRFLDASVARIYELALMTSTQGPRSAASLGLGGDELQGQYRIPDGQQAMRFTEIATDGGLLPFAIPRDSFELWPAKRREVIVDFSRWQDGSPTKAGDKVYLTNIMKMPTGRIWASSTRFSPDPRYKVPLVEFRIGTTAPDNSVLPGPNDKLRDLPPLRITSDMFANRLVFEVQRGSAGGELEWLINGKPFDPHHELTSLRNPAGDTPPAKPALNSFALWEIRNGGGGWVHPIHLHMEEHRTIQRNGRDTSVRPAPGHPDDVSREDLVALDPSEDTILYRGFRDFRGRYVAHCHNLAHEDHAMMFGWTVV
jgi:FtsP/CotA-like multicopper oxidase with cupredoxin domain